MTEPKPKPYHKLPDYETLKKLYLSGMSFADIGEKYGCKSRTGVYRTIKARAEERGEWPLRPRLTVKTKIRHWQRDVDFSVDGRAIIDLVEEYIRETEMTNAQFADKANLPVRYIVERRRMLHRTGKVRLRKDYAARLLEVIGETAPEFLRTGFALGRRCR